MKDENNETSDNGCFLCTLAIFVAIIGFIASVIYRTVTYYDQ